MKKIIISLLSVIVLLGLAGCTKKDNTPIQAEVKIINSLYTNDLWNVDRLEMLRSDGVKKSTNDMAVILDWLYKVGKLEITVDPAPEDRAGVLFSVAFYEGEQIKFSMAPAAINGTAILINDELVDYMYALWDSEELIDIK